MGIFLGGVEGVCGIFFGVRVLRMTYVLTNAPVVVGRKVSDGGAVTPQIVTHGKAVPGGTPKPPSPQRERSGLVGCKRAHYVCVIRTPTRTPKKRPAALPSALGDFRKPNLIIFTESRTTYRGLTFTDAMGRLRPYSFTM